MIKKAAVVLAVLMMAMAAAPGAAQSPAEARLAAVETWFYYLDVNLGDDTISQIIDSDYDMVVIDLIVSEAENQDYDIAGTVAALQDSGKLVIAYMDIGQAESYRTYWQPGWTVGDPAWIVGEDPDGWTENYPVAFWWDEWQALWFDPGTGLLQQVVDAGFDGVYMDWVEAYSDENVLAAAEVDGVDAVQEIVWFVEDISAYTKAQREDFIVIAQNAPELVDVPGYLDVIDAIAMEATWFDGAADGEIPEGDCPLPATDADIDSAAYRASLSAPCLALLDSDPNSQLHTSTAWYLDYLTQAHDAGEVIFTVDYALAADNVAWVFAESRGYGFIPFAGPRALNRFMPVAGPGK